MKSIIRSIALFLAIIASPFVSVAAPSSVDQAQTIVVTGQRLAINVAVSDASALPKIATTETFVLSKGDSLWKNFIAQNRPKAEWEKYWVEASEYSGLAHTDEAWRNLPVGFTVRVPRSPDAILADHMRAEIDALRSEISAIQQELAMVNEALVAEQFRSTLIAYGLVFSFIIILLLVSIALLLNLRVEREKRAKADLLEQLKSYRLEHPHTLGENGGHCCGTEEKKCCNEASCSNEKAGGCCGGGSCGNEHSDNTCKAEGCCASAVSDDVTSAADVQEISPMPLDQPFPKSEDQDKCVCMNENVAPDSVRLILCEIYPNFGNAYGYDEKTGQRYLLNEGTKGFHSDLVVGTVFRAVVTSDNFVTSIVSEEHQPK